MFYRRAIFIFYRCQNCPLNFISRNRNFYIIFRLKNNTNDPTFGSPNSPEINDVIKSAQKRNTWKTFFSKIDIIESRARSTLAPIYDSFPRWGGNCPKEKSFTSIFSETTVFFWTFFHHRIRFDWGHKWPRPESADIRRLGVGSKTNFRKGWKVAFLQKKSGNLVFLHTCFHEKVILYIILEIWESLGNSFRENGVRIHLGSHREFICQRVLALPRWIIDCKFYRS